MHWGAQIFAPLSVRLSHSPVCSVFNDEEQWRTPRRETPPADADPDGALSGEPAFDIAEQQVVS